MRNITAKLNIIRSFYLHKSLIKIVNQTIDKNENIVGVVLGNIVLFIWMEVIVK